MGAPRPSKYVQRVCEVASPPPKGKGKGKSKLGRLSPKRSASPAPPGDGRGARRREGCHLASQHSLLSSDLGMTTCILLDGLRGVLVSSSPTPVSSGLVRALALWCCCALCGRFALLCLLGAAVFRLV